MLKVNSLTSIVTPDISGDLVTVLTNMMAAENPPLFDLLAALTTYEADLIKAAQSTEVEPAEIAELNRQIADRDTTIAQLKLETAPDIASIAPALQAAGLTAFA